jgi:hypothetical protein
MTKQQVIDILEAYKPSGNIYNGYNSIEEKIDERICYLIDEIVESVKREPDDDSKWIKCNEKMPEPMRQVLFYDECFKECATGYYNKNYNAIQVGCALLGIDGEYERFTHWMPIPELPKED